MTVFKPKPKTAGFKAEPKRTEPGAKFSNVPKIFLSLS